MMGCWVRVGYTRGCGRATEVGCKEGKMAALFVTVIGLGDPADVAEYIPLLGDLR